MAQADIDIADDKLLPRAVEVYNTIFRPKREVDFFKRRFMGALQHRSRSSPGWTTSPLLASGWVSSSSPGMFYHSAWSGSSRCSPAWRRSPIAGCPAGLGQGSWIRIHPVRIRMNHQREFIHFAVNMGYDIVGIRWDSTRTRTISSSFEKNLME